MTFRQFVEHAKRGVIMNGRKFKHPDDDWLPVLIVELATERTAVCPIPTELFRDELGKDVLVEGVVLIARKMKARKLAMVLSSWISLVDMTTPEGYAIAEGIAPRVAPSQDPQRKEIVNLMVLDGERAEFHFAYIHRRRRKPPVLGPWEMWVQGQDGQTVEGRFADPRIQEALR